MGAGSFSPTVHILLTAVERLVLSAPATLDGAYLHKKVVARAGVPSGFFPVQRGLL